MKDCSNCKDSAINRPELRVMRFEDTPCAKCTPKEPSRTNMVSYGNQFEHPSEKTWKVLKTPDEEYSLMTFRYWLDAWLQLDEIDRQTLAAIVKNKGKSLSQIGERMGMSKQAVHKRIVRIRTRYPGTI